MKVIHLTYSNFIGGASIAANRINNALNKEKINSMMWVNESNVIKAKNKKIINKLAKSFERTRRFITWPLIKTLKTNIPIHHSISILPSKWVKLINKSDADFVHLHWVQREMLSIHDIGIIKKPIIWTLHDMWPFCGAEHYTNDNRWRQGYNINNRPNYETGFDLNRWTWQRKKFNWKNPIHIVTPSKWLAKCVSESQLMSSWPVNVIANPIDTNYWKPLDKTLARKEFNLPIDVNLLLFGAIGGTKDPRKGFDLLIKSLKYLKNDLSFKKLELVILGQKTTSLPFAIDFPIHFIGHTNDKKILRSLYNAVDALVIPSRQDNLPNTGLEANACATPVIAFNTGGLADIVEHRHTGYLAEPYVIMDLANGISWVLRNIDIAKLSINTRKRAIEKFSESLIAKKYLAIYKKVLNQVNLKKNDGKNFNT